MTQSVELLVDAATEDVVRDQWAALAQAGLPSEQRDPPSPSHRPHLTLYAADSLDRGAEPALDALAVGLDLTLQLGSVLVFGPRKGRCVVVRPVVATAALLDLQARVAAACSSHPGPHFAAGSWVPHVTLAHRVPTDQLGAVVETVGGRVDVVRVRQVRRWDSDRKIDWLLGHS